MEHVDEYPNTKPAISNNGFLLLVAVFPVLFAWALTLLIKAFVPFSSIDADTEFATIHSPQHNRTISRNYSVNGVTKQDFLERPLFLVEESNGAIYPKTAVSQKVGPWSANLYTGARADIDFRIVLIAVTPEDKEQFNAWLKTGEQTGKYPGLPLSESMQELTAVTVKVAE